MQIISRDEAVKDTQFQNFAEIHDQNARAVQNNLAQTKFGAPSVPSAPSLPTGAADDAKKKADEAKGKADAAQGDAKKKADDAKADADKQKQQKDKALAQAKQADDGAKKAEGDAAAEVPGAVKVNPASIVIKGQWVKNEDGKDLILFDPTDQAY